MYTHRYEKNQKEKIAYANTLDVAKCIQNVDHLA